jgi:LysM repeat protein
MEGDDGERATFGKVARNCSHYGTSAKAASLTQLYIQYAVQQTDTIQGIAVKYGVTVSRLAQLLGTVLVKPGT